MDQHLTDDEIQALREALGEVEPTEKHAAQRTKIQEELAILKAALEPGWQPFDESAEWDDYHIPPMPDHVRERLIAERDTLWAKYLANPKKAKPSRHFVLLGLAALSVTAIAAILLCYGRPENPTFALRNDAVPSQSHEVRIPWGYLKSVDLTAQPFKLELFDYAKRQTFSLTFSSAPGGKTLKPGGWVSVEFDSASQRCLKIDPINQWFGISEDVRPNACSLHFFKAHHPRQLPPWVQILDENNGEGKAPLKFTNDVPGNNLLVNGNWVMVYFDANQNCLGIESIDDRLTWLETQSPVTEGMKHEIGRIHEAVAGIKTSRETQLQQPLAARSPIHGPATEVKFNSTMRRIVQIGERYGMKLSEEHWPSQAG